MYVRSYRVPSAGRSLRAVEMAALRTSLRLFDSRALLHITAAYENEDGGVASRTVPWPAELLALEA